MKAFPQLAHWDIDERNGMELRDYFASKVMQSLLISQKGRFNMDDIARCFRIADAMMEARKMSVKDKGEHNV
jgi:hypothetical protein